MGLRNRWNYSGYPYFVTTTVVEWVNVFKDKNYFDILCESLIFCKNKFACRLFACCLMPNHIHLILWPNQNHRCQEETPDGTELPLVEGDITMQDVEAIANAANSSFPLTKP